MGYYRAGFDVTGVDIAPQPHYPFRFIHADALSVALRFGVVHASPPCQAYSSLRSVNLRRSADLVSRVRERLVRAGVTYVIENVAGAPLRNAVQLCGTAFLDPVRCIDGRIREVRRHRLFESNAPLTGSACSHHHPALGVYGGGFWQPGTTARGGYQGPAAERRAALQVSWMNRDEMAEAIPPVYTEHIGRQLLEHLQPREGQCRHGPALHAG